MTRSTRLSKFRRSLLRLRLLEDRSVPSSVQGTVFNDANSNGVFDSGETGLASWTVYVDNNRDGILNLGEVSTVTGATGDYFIDTTLIPPNSNGSNYMALDLQVGSGGRWLNTTPTLLSANPTNEPNAIRNFGVYFQPDASVQPIGPEAMVNTTTANAQDDASIDSDAAGNYVVAWRSTVSGGNSVVARVFNSDGSPRTGEISVGSGIHPRVSMADNGQFAVGWSAGPALARVYNSAGVPVTGAITVIGAASNVSNYVTGVAMDADGDFAVLVTQAVTSTHGKSTTYTYPLKLQRYTAVGSANGKLIQVDDSQNFLSAGDANIAMDDAGRFVVVWQDALNGVAGVYAQRYAANGQVSGTLMTVATGSQYGISSAVAMNSTGQFAITWNMPSQHLNKLALFDLNGAAIGSAVAFATDYGAAQLIAPVTIDDASNTTVTWSHSGTSYPSTDHVEIHYRRLLADSTFEPASIVNSTTQGRQVTPTLVATGTNQFVVAWDGYGPGDDAGIFAQRFAPPAPPPFWSGSLGNNNNTNIATSTASTGSVGWWLSYVDHDDDNLP